MLMSKTEWMRQYREKNREKYNAYHNEWNKKHRKQRPKTFTMTAMKQNSKAYERNFKELLDAYKRGDSVTHQKCLKIEKKLEMKSMLMKRRISLKRYEVFNEQKPVLKRVA